ncbi:MAG TPA: hypothetical protein VNC78_01370 [Actinomycetota bacterium]|nr:hypothetical protein [Actinomycetota bacterium]
MELAGSICEDALCGAMFFAIFTGPFVLAAAVVGTLIIRRIARERGKALGPWGTFITYIVLVVVFFPAAYGLLALKEHSEAKRYHEAAVRSIDYPTYWPAELPDGFEVTGITVSGSSAGGTITITYDTPIGYMQAFQSPTLGGLSELDPEDCKDDPNTIRIGSPRCRLLVTPEGNEVVITSSPEGCEAALEIEATRLRLECLGLADDSVARYFDSMELIEVSDLEFSEPRLTDSL